MPDVKRVRTLISWCHSVVCRLSLGVVAVGWAGAALADAASAPAAATTSAQPASPPPPDLQASVPSAMVPRRWSSIPRVKGRLAAKDIGVVINTEDPYSVQVGEYYIKARQIPPDNVLRLKLLLAPNMNRLAFADLLGQINDFYGDRVQGLALVWRAPHAVACNSITGALAMGFDGKLCEQTCAPSRVSPYFASGSARPYADLGMRLSMLLAAPTVEAAKALIDRGVAADGTQGKRGGPPSNIHLVSTADTVRSVRRHLFPPAGGLPRLNLVVHHDQVESLKGAERVLMYLTGRVRVDDLNTVQFVPGALADHLTSFGGGLDFSFGQMTVMDWIAAGVTASYGTTSEPCSHLQKFPHPEALIQFYAQGATALEAYWKSVAWPQQGLFVGEPLAAPFSPRPAPSD